MDHETLQIKIDTMKKGDRFYIDTLDLTVKSIALLRKAIKAKVLLPDIRKVEKMVHKDVVGSFMCGESIAPQMNYIKQ